MGSSSKQEEEEEAISTPKLALLSIQLSAGRISRHDFESAEEHESGMLTPPLHTSASVPFRWEEEPGKPRPCTALIPTTTTQSDHPNTTTSTNIIKGLELPPRLHYLVTTATDDQKMTKMPSPTTVLDGPYYTTTSNLPLLFQSSSFRFTSRRREERRRQGSFGSSSCGSPDQRGQFGNSTVLTSKKKSSLLLDDNEERKGKRSPVGGGGGGGFFGSWRRKSTSSQTAAHKRGKSSSDVGGGSFVFSSSVEIVAGFGGGGGDVESSGGGGAKVSSRISRNGSFSSLSQVRSHFWATIYKGFKQVLPLKSSSSKKDGLPV